MKRVLVFLLFIILVLMIQYLPVISVYSQIVSAKLNYYLSDNISYLSLTPLESDDLLRASCDYKRYSKHTFDNINFLAPLYSKNKNIKNHEVPFSMSISNEKLISVIHSSISKEIYSITNKNSELDKELKNLLKLNKFNVLKDILSITPEELNVFGRLEMQYLNNIKLSIKKGILLPETKSMLYFSDIKNINSILILVDDYHYFAFVYEPDSADMYQIVFRGLDRHDVSCVLKSLQNRVQDEHPPFRVSVKLEEVQSDSS